MTVIVDGKSVERPISHMEPNSVGFMETVPVLHDGEDFMRLVSGEVMVFKRWKS